MQNSSHIVTSKKPTPNVLQAGRPFCRPTNSVNALMEKIKALGDILKSRKFEEPWIPLKRCLVCQNNVLEMSGCFAIVVDLSHLSRWIWLIVQYPRYVNRQFVTLFLHMSLCCSTAVTR